MPWYAPGPGQHPHWANAGSALEKSFRAMGWVETDGTIPTPGVPPDPAATRLVRAINGKLADTTGGITLTADDVDAVSDTGDTVTGSVTLQSSYPGDDVQGGIDGTSRLNLQSYQRANWNSFGEVVRIYSKRANSKQMVAWYGPTSYDATTLEPIGSDKPWFWLGAHYGANDGGPPHGHWSMEVPDTTGALQTRLELPIWDPVTGVYGMDKGVIKTNAADLNVRTSNGQEFRLSAPAGNEKPIMFSNDSNGGDEHRRWKLFVTNEAEAGSNVGSNFQLVRYDDTGVVVDAPIVVSRSTGNVTLATGIVATKGAASSLRINTASLGGGVGVVAIGNANVVPTGTPTGGGVLFAEAGALKWRNSAGVTTTIAPA